MPLFEGQDKAIIKMELRTLSGNPPLEGANTAEIHYFKPNGDTGHFNAAFQTEQDVEITYELQQGANEIDQVGQWVLWPKITYSDGKVAYGSPEKYKVKKVGVY